MPKPFSLQTVLDLMQARTDEATHRLARLIANERNAKNKLDMLQQYRDEYAARFREASQNGISQREWHNYQEFLARLDEAIDTQQGAVQLEAKRTADGQEAWRQQKTKLRAFDTLSARHSAKEAVREQKREQKNQDDFAARTTIYREES